MTTSRMKAKGWALVFEDQIDMRTVSSTRHAVIVNWLFANCRVPLADMTDEEIEQLWKVHGAEATVAEIIIEGKE